MAEFVGAHKDTLSETRTKHVMGLWSEDGFGDAGAVDFTIDAAQLAAFDQIVVAAPLSIGQLASGAMAACGAARRGEFSVWSEQTEALGQLSSTFDGILAVERQWDQIAVAFKEAMDDPRYAELGKRLEMVKQARLRTMEVLPRLLTPWEYKGAPAVLPVPKINTLERLDVVLAAIREQLEPVFEAADFAQSLGESSRGKGGRKLERRALELTLGPLGTYPVGSPEFQLVWAAFDQACAGEPVNVRVRAMLGLDAPDAVEDPKLALFDSAKAVIDESGANAATWGESGHVRTAESASGEGDPAEAEEKEGVKPGFQEFDASELAEGPEEEEEKAPKGKSNPGGKRRRKDRVKDEEIEVENGVEGNVKTKEGGVEGELGVTREKKHASGAGSTVGANATGGVGEKGVYGTVGLSGEHRQRDEGSTRRKPKGMDVTGGVSGGVDEDGHAVVNANVGTTLHHGDGTSTSVNKTVGYDANGYTIGGGVGRAKNTAGGGKQETTVGATISSNGTVGASYGTAKKDSKGEVKSATNVSGSADLFGDDKSAAGAVSHQAGNVVVSADGKWTQKLAAPVRQPDGRWLVEFETSLGGGGSVGGKAGKVGAHVGGHLDKSTRGKRTFATEKEALAFYGKGDIPSGPANAADAKAMAEGDSVSTRTGASVEGGADAKIGLVSVGAGASAGESHFENTTREAGGKLRVEIGEDSFNGWNASVGAGGVSVGYGSQSGVTGSQTVEFDLETPVGEWAYNYYKSSGQLPSSGRGWKLVGTMKGDNQTRVKSVGALGLSLGVTHQTSHTETDADGHHTVEDAGTEGRSASVPLIGSHNESHAIYERQIDGGDAIYQTTTSVKSSSLDGVQSALNRGSDLGEGASGSNKGAYKLSAAYSQADIDGFIKKVLAGTARGGDTWTDFGDLRGAINSAKDADGRRRALAAWVADEGESALQAISDVTKGSGNSDFYVEIEGDPYMKGMDGHIDQELRIHKWQDRIDAGEGGFGIANEVRTDLACQRKRRDALRDYGELPPAVLKREYERTDAHLANLQLLLDRALASVTEMENNSSTGQETGLYQRAVHLLTQSRKQYSDAHWRVSRARRIHLDGMGARMGLHFDKSARQDMTGEEPRYHQADLHYNAGVVREFSAHQWESTIASMELGPDNGGLLASNTTRAAFEYQAAARAFDEASEVYGEIASRRTDKSHWFDGYDMDFVDGQ